MVYGGSPVYVGVNTGTQVKLLRSAVGVGGLV